MNEGDSEFKKSLMKSTLSLKGSDITDIEIKENNLCNNQEPDITISKTRDTTSEEKINKQT